MARPKRKQMGMRPGVAKYSGRIDPETYRTRFPVRCLKTGKFFQSVHGRNISEQMKKSIKEDPHTLKNLQKAARIAIEAQKNHPNREQMLKEQGKRMKAWWASLDKEERKEFVDKLNKKWDDPEVVENFLKYNFDQHRIRTAEVNGEEVKFTKKQIKNGKVTVVFKDRKRKKSVGVVNE